MNSLSGTTNRIKIRALLVQANVPHMIRNEITTHSGNKGSDDSQIEHLLQIRKRLKLLVPQCSIPNPSKKGTAITPVSWIK